MCGKSLQLKHHKCEKVCKIKNLICGKSLPFIMFTDTNPHYRHTTGTLQAHYRHTQAHYRHTTGTHTQITKLDGFDFYK